MGMHKQMLGKIGPATPEQYLREYIARKQDTKNNTKLTFEEWYSVNELKTYNKTEYDCMKMAWYAGQENV